MPLRVLVAKVGFDGHDRGVKIITRILRDAGMEVIYLGLRQTPATIAAAAVHEDVDVVGLSMHNAAHRALAPKVVAALRDAGVDSPVVVGGIVPDVDIPYLLDRGVAAVLGPGCTSSDVVHCVRDVGGRAALTSDGRDTHR